MLILGVDPGLAKTGWGTVRTGQRLMYADSGLFRTSAQCPHIERLRIIGGELKKVLAKTAPDLIAVERVFINKNPNSSLLLGEARGAVLMTLLEADVPVVEISALQVKQSVTGIGRAGKQQVADMVGRLLNISVAALPHDCTDALACALAAQTQRPFRRQRSSRRTLSALARKLQ